ncbi:MAG: PorP/SprF family type IX secretion system membrane protein [Bacteroidota bacterium]
MMRYLKFAAVFLICSLPAAAQDFHLSQYSDAPLNHNPAMTGLFDGHYRIHAHYRTQWAAIATKPFVTSLISYDMPLKKIAIGGQINNYRAGAGSYNVLGIELSAAYDMALGASGNNHLSIGIQAGIIQKSVNLNRLYFNDQYTTADGGGFDTGLPSGEIFSNASIFLPDVNAGLMYYYGNEQARLMPFLGFSAFHLTQPNESFYGAPNRLPVRFNLNGGLKINISGRIQLLPQFLAMQQANARERTASLLLHYYLKSSDSYIILGGTYRQYDANIFEAGLKFGKYAFKVSYDINTSALKPNTSGRGGVEFSFSFITSRPKPEFVPDCPRI